MKYPSLVPKRLCRIPIQVTLYEEGISEDGAPLTHDLGELMCNYQDSAKTVLTAEKKLVQLAGVAMFYGDIAPEAETISGGKVVVHGIQRDIFQGIKARNPDGTVNYTELRLV